MGCQRSQETGLEQGLWSGEIAKGWDPSLVRAGVWASDGCREMVSVLATPIISVEWPQGSQEAFLKKTANPTLGRVFPDTPKSFPAWGLNLPGGFG